jgi:methylthioribulose 1-phosphate dehydratase/enolase-phosphatase E1
MKSLGLSFIGPPLCGPTSTSTSKSTSATTTTTATTTATANGKVEGGSASTSPSKKKKRAQEEEEEEKKKKKRESGKADSADSVPTSHKVVLLDIEGTTTPITFVKAVLFPYAAKHLREHLKATWGTDKTKGYVAALAKQAATEKDKAAPTPMAKTVEGVTKYCQWLISVDRKAGALKQMQGDIWKVGYDRGELKAVVYDDVPRLFKRVVGAGNKICIYSSGSRGAQKMLFQNSDQGDLTGDISAYFDTKVGPKREAPSYAEILLYLGVDKPSDVLFLTDVVEEAVAAKAVGMDTVISHRPGNCPLPPKHGFRVVTDFDDIH